MDETLDQLGDRLHPRHLLDDVIDLFRGDGSGRGSQLAAVSQRAGSNFAAQIKEHPLPALLVGAGLVWWLVDSGEDKGERSQSRDRDYPAEPDYYAADPDAYLEPDEGFYRDPLTPAPPLAGLEPVATAGVDPGNAGAGEEAGLGERLKEGAAAVGGKIGDAASQIRTKVSGAGHEVGSRAHGAGRQVGQATSAGWQQARSGLHQSARAVGRRGNEAAERIREAGDDHPLAIGGICLAAGLLAGLLLPRTERENALMGEAADELRADLRSRGEELVEQGRNVANRAVEAAQGEAGDQGVAPSNLADKAARVVSDAFGAARRAAEEEGLTPQDLKDKAGAVAQATKDAAQEEAGRPRSAQTTPV